jgi:signal transduction histidine kinase
LKTSLRNKIIIWSFVPTAIILVAVALVSLYTYQRVTENLAIERDRELTRLSAKLLAAELATYTDPLTGQYLSAFDGLVIFDAQGTVLLAEPEQYERWKPTWFEDIVVFRALSSSRPVFSDVVIDTLQGEKFIVVVMPLADQEGRFTVGIAGLFRVGSTTGNALYRSIEKIHRQESICVYLVDGNGQVIYHTNPDYVGESFATQTVVELVLDGQVGAYRTTDLEGREIVASFAPVPGTSWGLVTEESWAELTRSSRLYGQFLFFLLALGVVVPAVIVNVGVRRITRPISELIGAAQEIAGGRFGRRIQSSTGDELEEMAEQFNLMAAQLQESYAHLEQKVADRTKELGTLNAIVAEVSHSLNLEVILNNALDEVLEVTGMETGQAFRLEEESQTLVSMAHRGLSEEFVCRTTRLPLEDSVAGQAAQEGYPIIKNVADCPEGELRGLVEKEGVQSMISVPLIAQGRTVGAMQLGAWAARSATAEELSLLAAIGQQIGVAVENARLYEQAQQLAVMKERNRLARDLHDSVTQALYGVALYAEAAARQLQVGQTDLVGAHLSEIRGTAQESLREMRLLIFELRPPILKQEGLVAALQSRLEAVEGRVGLETEFEAQIDGRLSPDVEEGLYRIAQEALNNALKHAHASRVAVRLCGNGQGIVLEIIDNGCGFDPHVTREHGGFGLQGMEERAVRLGGLLTVQSRPGQGTKLRVEVNR